MSYRILPDWRQIKVKPKSCLSRIMMSLVPFGNWPERKLCLWVLLLRNFCGNSSRWHGLRKIRHLTMMIICNPYNPVYSELNSFMVNIPILYFVKISDIQRLSFVVTGCKMVKLATSELIVVYYLSCCLHLRNIWTVVLVFCQSHVILQWQPRE